MARETYAQIAEEHDLDRMRERLNTACAGGRELDLAELQEIRRMVERMQAVKTWQEHLHSWQRFSDSPGAGFLAEH